MFYVADLHIHSHYSRATSKDLNLDTIYQWAKIKGINVVGTGDFTHPQWYNEIKEKLVPDGTGFFRMKDPPVTEALPGIKTSDIDVRFCLSAEISSIYKYDGRVRKNHNIIFAPDLESAQKINARLSVIGNLKSDGRPILGLPSRDLLEIVLKTSDNAFLIPAHVWTPWFSTLGSKAGYDSIGECYRDLTEYIFALETGLSSDPSMNWRLSDLDRYSLVSNSDAHSAQRLGREANVFDTELSYFGMFNALKTRQGFLGTYEFFPEEGKYHLDGHRKCGIVFEPDTTNQHKGICPVCHRPLTIGVLHRVEKLADRSEGIRPANSPGFHYLIPLPEILSEIKGSGPSSKSVQGIYQQIVSEFGNEFTFLMDAPAEDIKKKCGYVISEAVRRMRDNEVNPDPGFDGEFGTIRIFNEGELESLLGQSNLFGFEASKMTKRKTIQSAALNVKEKQDENRERVLVLNPEQELVRNSKDKALLVSAGPGTGKTETLIQWIISRIDGFNDNSRKILAITFTNKAADEILSRLKNIAPEGSGKIMAGTFHSVCFGILQEKYPELSTIYDREGRCIVLRMLFPGKGDAEIKKLSDALSEYFEAVNQTGVPDIEHIAGLYCGHNRKHNAVDLSYIIGQTVKLLGDEPEFLDRMRERYSCIAVDEFQDINPLQYRFIKLLATDKNILAIGDPDQAIYGFRGSDVKLFFRFKEDFSAAEINLSRNYRSSEIILNAAGNIIANNSLRSNLKLIAGTNNLKKVKVYNALDTAAEAKYILNEIDGYIGGTENLSIGSRSAHSSYSFSDISVLFRTHTVGRELLRELKKKGIPVHYGDGSSYLEEPPFSLISDMLRLIVNPADLVSLKSVMVKGLEYSESEAGLFIKNIYAEGADWVGRALEPGRLTGLDEAERFTGWQEFYNTLKDSYQSDMPLSVIEKICDFFLPEDKLDDMHILKREAILNFASESEGDAYGFLRRMMLGNYSDVGRLRSEGVSLLTFHAAKGLEFPVVFIAGAEEGITPLTGRNADIEEERRLFYVALTRARDEVHITWSSQRRLYGREEHTEPSRFIGEAGEALVEKINDVPKRKEEARERQLSLF
jgi:DNA helicase-2/ATP-dependent DNA helicase PcrA